MDSKTKDFMEYLGKEDQTTINEILGLDNAQKKRKAVAADPTAEKSEGHCCQKDARPEEVFLKN